MALLDRFRTKPAPAPPPVPVPVRKARAITASAVVITPKGGPVSKPPKRENWHNDSWGYYDTVGEVHYAHGFVGACLSRVRLRPGWMGDDMKVGPVFDEDGKQLEHVKGDAELASQLVRMLKSPLGGQPALLKALGMNISATGDCFLLGADTLDPQQRVVDRSWEVLSTDELQPKSGGTGWTRKRSPNATPEDLGDDAYPLRIWNPHPRYSSMSDSAMRGVLDICEELVLLTRQVRAGALSRLTGPGVYWLPEEISFPNDDDDPDDDSHPFSRQLIKAMTTPIQEPGTASAVVPMVATAPGDQIVKIRHDKFDASDDSGSVMKRTEAIQRLAQGIDLPVEIVTGHAQTTFANAESIDEATFKAHIEPRLELICDALAAGYLRPQLLAAAGIDVASGMPEEIARMTVWYDASELLADPDRSTEAVQVYDRLELSGQALRRHTGFAESDAPDEEEVARRLWIKQQQQVRETVRNQGEMPTESDVVDSEGDSGLAVVASADGLPANRLELRVATAAEYATARALDRAGARLRSKCNGRADIKETPNCELPARLGKRKVAELVPVEQLLHGEFEVFRRTIAMWGGEAGHAAPQAFADDVTELVQSATAERLFDPHRRLDLHALLAAVRS